MRFVLRLVMYVVVLMPVSAQAALVPSADGKTVYDTVMHVTWLVNANLA